MFPGHGKCIPTVLRRTIIHLSDLFDLRLVVKYTKTSMRTVCRILREHKIRGTVRTPARVKPIGRPRKLTSDHMDVRSISPPDPTSSQLFQWIKGQLLQNPTCFLDELLSDLQEACPTANVSLKTLWRALRHEGYQRKKVSSHYFTSICLKLM